MAEIVESFETPGGQTLLRTRDTKGQERWRTKSSGEFRSDKQVEQLKQNASQRAQRESDPSLNVQYNVTPSDENARRNAIRRQYGGFDNTVGLDPNKTIGGEPHNNRIKGWMGNDELQRQIENDPLLRTNKERDKAIESRAREIVADLEGADSDEAIEILRKYDIY